MRYMQSSHDAFVKITDYYSLIFVSHILYQWCLFKGTVNPFSTMFPQSCRTLKTQFNFSVVKSEVTNAVMFWLFVLVWVRIWKYNIQQFP